MRASVQSPVALFSKTKTKEAAPAKEAAPKQTGWFSPKPKQATAQKPAAKTSKAAEYKCVGSTLAHTAFTTPDHRKGVSLLGSITNALDFNEVRSQSDAELLYDAKYGKRGEDGRMSRYGGIIAVKNMCTHRMHREQYRALRRKIGGTGRDFFKVRVEEKRALRAS